MPPQATSLKHLGMAGPLRFLRSSCDESDCMNGSTTDDNIVCGTDGVPQPKIVGSACVLVLQQYASYYAWRGQAIVSCVASSSFRFVVLSLALGRGIACSTIKHPHKVEISYLSKKVRVSSDFLNIHIIYCISSLWYAPIGQFRLQIGRCQPVCILYHQINAVSLVSSNLVYIINAFFFHHREGAFLPKEAMTKATIDRSVTFRPIFILVARSRSRGEWRLFPFAVFQLSCSSNFAIQIRNFKGNKRYSKHYRRITD